MLVVAAAPPSPKGRAGESWGWSHGGLEARRRLAGGCFALTHCFVRRRERGDVCVPVSPWYAGWRQPPRKLRMRVRCAAPASRAPESWPPARTPLVGRARIGRGRAAGEASEERWATRASELHSSRERDLSSAQECRAAAHRGLLASPGSSAACARNDPASCLMRPHPRTPGGLLGASQDPRSTEEEKHGPKHWRRSD